MPPLSVAQVKHGDAALWIDVRPKEEFARLRMFQVAMLSNETNGMRCFRRSSPSVTRTGNWSFIAAGKVAMPATPWRSDYEMRLS